MMLNKLAVVLCLPVLACANKTDAAPDQQTPPAAATTATPAAAAGPDTSLERADKARILGPESAKVWLVMASDFQCPYCRDFEAQTWPSIDRDYVKTGKIRVAFMNHPMPFHPFAIPAAEAAMCAGKQDKFWQMHDSLFATQEKWVKSGKPQPFFETFAKAIGLRMDDWNTCVSTHATRSMIEADFKRTSDGGVKGTPSFFIANVFAIEGVAPYAQFRQQLDAAIAKAGGR